MRQAGYQMDDVPADGDTLIQSLIDRCSYDQTFLTDEQLAAAAGHVPVEQYQRWFDELPESQRQRMQRAVGTTAGRSLRSRRRASRWPGSSWATCSWPCSRRAVTAWTPTPSIISPICRRRTIIMPSIAGCATPGRPTRSSTSASTARSNGCPARASGCRPIVFPTASCGDLPLLYPFIINNPGEGAQAKRRAHAVVVDHLVPPMTTADTYGPTGRADAIGRRILPGRNARPARRCRCCSSRFGI